MAASPWFPRVCRGAGARFNPGRVAARSLFPCWTARRGGICLLGLVAGVVAVARHDVEAPVQAVLLVVRAGGEEQRVDRLLGLAVAEGDPPQAGDVDRLAVRTLDAADEAAAGQVVGVDGAVAKVP